MMDPQIGRTALSIAGFLIIGSIVSLFIAEAGSAEAIVSIVTLGLGVVLIALVGLFARLSR